MVKVLVTETCNGCGGTDAKAVCVRSCPAKILTVKKRSSIKPESKRDSTCSGRLFLCRMLCL